MANAYYFLTTFQTAQLYPSENYITFHQTGIIELLTYGANGTTYSSYAIKSLNINTNKKIILKSLTFNYSLSWSLLIAGGNICYVKSDLAPIETIKIGVSITPADLTATAQPLKNTVSGFDAFLNNRIYIFDTKGIDGFFKLDHLNFEYEFNQKSPYLSTGLLVTIPNSSYDFYETILKTRYNYLALDFVRSPQSWFNLTTNFELI